MSKKRTQLQIALDEVDARIDAAGKRYESERAALATIRAMLVELIGQRAPNQPKTPRLAITERETP